MYFNIKTELALSLLMSLGIAIAAPTSTSESAVLNTIKSVNNSNVVIKFVNNNIQMTFTNKNSEPAIITQINQYVNNAVSCASSNSSYLIQSESTLTIMVG